MRTSRLALFSIGLGWFLIFVFALFAVGMKFYVLTYRHITDEELLAELAPAEFLDDDPAPSADWPQWLGPRRDGIASLPDLLTKWPDKGPPRLWQKRIGESYSSFAVAGGGRVYTMAALDEGEAVFCWDLATGEEHWHYSFASRRAFQFPGPRATPTIDGDRLYALTPSGLLMCLNARDGKPVWQRILAEEIGATPPTWGLSCSPLVEGDLVFVIASGSQKRCLAAFKKDTGEIAWTGEGDAAGYSSPVAATIGGVRQVIFLTGERLLGVRPADGEVLWEFPWKAQFQVNAATPVVFRTRSGGEESTYVFVSSGYDRGCALVKVARQGGKFRARRVFESDQLCCHFSTPVRLKEHVYGLDEKRDLTCLDLRSGRVKWRFERPEGAEGLRSVGYKKGSLLRIDGMLLILGEDGKLALVEATPEEYREVAAARPFRDRCWTVPTLAGGRLLIRDVKQILCLDVRRRSGEK